MSLLISTRQQNPLRIVIIYRPPTTEDRRPTAPIFFREFPDFLERLIADPQRLLIAGDFNFDLDDQSNREASTFRDLLSSVNFVQHVDFPTHLKGHTLDIIASRPDDAIVFGISCTGYLPSDHAVVQCKLSIGKPDPVKTDIKYRKVSDINLEAFRKDILQSELYTCPADDVNELVIQYGTVLKTLFDKRAPIITRTITSRPHSPWYNSDLREAKQMLRRSERRLRISKLEVHRQIFRHESKKYEKALTQAKKEYYSL